MAKRKKIEPPPYIGGMGETNENSVRFLEYKMRKMSDFIEFDVKFIKMESIAKTIIDSVENDIDGDIYNIVGTNVVFSESSKEGNDSIIDRVSIEIINSIKIILGESVKSGIEEVIDIGKIRSPIEGMTKDVHYSIVYTIRGALQYAIMSAIRNSIDDSIISIIKNCDGCRTKKGIKTILKELDNLIYDGVEDGLDYSFDDVYEIVATYSKTNKDDSDDNYIIYVPFDLNKFREDFGLDSECAYRVKKPDSLNRQEILFSLLNLYIELKDKPLINQGEDVINWCGQYVFPYNFEILRQTANENPDDVYWDDYWIYLSEDNMLLFELKDFLKDLRALAECTVELLALVKTRNHNEENDNRGEAQKLLKDSTLFNPAEFFADYDTGGPLRSYMSQRILNRVPKMQMALKFSPKDGKIVFEPIVNSVFDLAWYALIRYAMTGDAETLAKLEEDGRKIRIAACEHCGGFYNKTRKTQRVCGKIDCQSFRYSEKQKTYDAKKREMERQNKVKYESEKG